MVDTNDENVVDTNQIMDTDSQNRVSQTTVDTMLPVMNQVLIFAVNYISEPKPPVNILFTSDKALCKCAKKLFGGQSISI